MTSARALFAIFTAVAVLAGSACGTDEPSGPRIIDVTVDRARLVPGQEATVTVVVVAGADGKTFISGQLVRGGQNLGAFVRSDANTFAAATDWEALAGSDLGGQMGEAVPATATARFYDEAGHMAEAQVMINLACTGTAQAVCNGTCLDVTSDTENCGGCGNSCSGTPEGQSSTNRVSCRSATCGLAMGQTTQRQSCADVCEAQKFQGRTMHCEPICLESGNNSITFAFGTGGQSAVTYYKNEPFTESGFDTLSDCGQVPGATLGDLDFAWQRCCCVAEF